jgi:hypothetical protein
MTDDNAEHADVLAELAAWEPDEEYLAEMREWDRADLAAPLPEDEFSRGEMWTYVLSRERHGEEVRWGIRELYRDVKEPGDLSWTADLVEASGDKPRDVADDLVHMLEAALAPVFLDLTLDPPRLVQREPNLG